MGLVLDKLKIPTGAVNAKVDSHMTRGACQADVRTQALGIAPGGVVAHGIEKGAVEVVGMETGAVRIVNQGEGLLVALVAALAIIALGNIENIVAMIVLLGIVLIGAVISIRRGNKDREECLLKVSNNPTESFIEKGVPNNNAMEILNSNIVDNNAQEHCVEETIELKEKEESEAHHQDTGNIRLGESISQASLSDMDYSVAASMVITNFSKTTMKVDKTFVTSGLIKIPAVDIPGMSCEAMAMHKYSGTATGTYGVTSFLLGVKEAKLVILWGVPFNQNHSSNWLGLVIVHVETVVDENTFNQMWYQKFHDNALKDFYYDTNTVTFSWGGWEVEGTMGSAHKTAIVVNVYHV